MCSCCCRGRMIRAQRVAIRFAEWTNQRSFSVRAASLELKGRKASSDPPSRHQLNPATRVDEVFNRMRSRRTAKLPSQEKRDSPSSSSESLHASERLTFPQLCGPGARAGSGKGRALSAARQADVVIIDGTNIVMGTKKSLRKVSITLQHFLHER